jgi:hypothetical protein
MEKLVDIFERSEQTGLPVRKLRGFVASRKIRFLKAGHRTLLFSPAKVARDLERFEVAAIGGAK